MQWQVFPIRQYPANLWQDWQQLVDKYHAGNPMLGSIFVQLLVDFFGDEQLYIARGECENNLSALLLLEKVKKGIWQGFKPSQAQLALLVMNQQLPLQIEILLSKLPETCLKLDLFSLDPYEHNNLLEDIPFDQKEIYAQNIRIAINGEFDEYWSHRPRKLRQNVNRYQNRLNREVGSYRIEYITASDDMPAATDRYGMLEALGWKGKIGTAIHPCNQQGQFYRQLMKNYAQNKQAIIYEMYLNDNLVASRLCFYSESLLVTLKTTFDENLKKHAVGRILLKELLEDVFTTKRVKEIDFYTNATSDQIDWSTEQRSMFNISVFSSKFIARLVSALSHIRKKIRS